MDADKYLKDLALRTQVYLFFKEDVEALISLCCAYKEALEWYAQWDWSDKYVQAIPKRAQKVLETGEELVSQRLIKAIPKKRASK